MTGYEDEAGQALAETYETVPSGDILGWLDGLIPSEPASILDVGAGSGRDAAWLPVCLTVCLPWPQTGARRLGPALACRSARPPGTRRRTAILAAAIAMACAVGGRAMADDVSWALRSGRTLTIYGQASPTTLTVDDGVASYFSVRDDGHATTRLGIDLTRRVGERSIRWTFETGFGLPTTGTTGQDTANDRWAWGEPTVRKAELQLSGPYGEWSLGQGSTATDGVATQDLSGTGVAGSSAIRDDAGSFEFRSARSGGLTGIRIGDVFANLDGNRRLRVRYDSPSREGYSLALAVGIDDFYEGAERFADAALRYRNDAGALQMRGAVGLSWQREGDTDPEVAWLGSLSALHPESGVSLTGATGLQTGGGGYAYVKAGHRSALVRVGDTRAAIDLYLGRDFESPGSRSRSVGLQLVQSWEARGVEAYLGLRHYAYDDRTGERYRDMNSTLAGLRWQF